MPVLGGHGGERYVPFCLTLFFFILFCNLFGLMPWGSTPTGNIAVTATLAIITFIVDRDRRHARRSGKGYIGTIIYWPHDMPLRHEALMTLIMTPVEIVGKFTKPFALTIRLFANMIAGPRDHPRADRPDLHVRLEVVGIAPLAMALFIMVLEILVAFIQAFIFSLLAAVVHRSDSAPRITKDDAADRAGRQRRT